MASEGGAAPSHLKSSSAPESACNRIEQSKVESRNLFRLPPFPAHDPKTSSRGTYACDGSETSSRIHVRSCSSPHGSLAPPRHQRFAFCSRRVDSQHNTAADYASARRFCEGGGRRYCPGKSGKGRLVTEPRIPTLNSSISIPLSSKLLPSLGKASTGMLQRLQPRHVAPVLRWISVRETDQAAGRRTSNFRLETAVPRLDLPLGFSSLLLDLYPWRSLAHSLVEAR